MEQNSIVNFCNRFASTESSITKIEDLSDGLLFLRILQLIQQTPIIQKNIKIKPETWQQKLSNLKLLLNSLNKLSLKHCCQNPETFDFDLLEIAKNQNTNQILQLFQKVLEAAINSENNNLFIHQITQLSTEDQQLFQSKIIRIIGQQRYQTSNSPTMSPKCHKDQEMLQKLGELQEEVKTLKTQNLHLEQSCKQLETELYNYKYENSKLKQNIYHIEREIADINQFKQSSLTKNLQHSQSLIQSLQDKLISENTQYQKKCIKLEEEIIILQTKLQRSHTAQQLLGQAQEKIQHFSEKVMILNEEKNDLSDRIRGKQNSIRILEDRVKSLNEDYNKKEFQRISLKAENAKSQARSSELQRMLEMSFQRKKSKNNFTLSSQTLDHMSDPFQAKYQQVRSQLNIANRRVKQLEKQLAKSNVRADKMQRLEQQKKKLQEVLIDQTNSRGEEVELLLSALHHLRCNYQVLLKKGNSEESILSTHGSIQCE